MKKLSLIIALALLVTIGSVYANWIYNDHTDVADITGSRAVTMTPATFDGGLGTYSVTTAGLTMKIDPKEGTTHTTSLLVDGEIVVTFTPSAYASNDIKNNAVPTKAIFRLPSSLTSVNDWQYDGKNIFTSIDSTPIDLVWSKQADGTFGYIQGTSSPYTQGVYVSLGLPEGDVNATALAGSMYRCCFTVLGYDAVMLCDYRDGARFLAEIERKNNEAYGTQAE